MATTKSRSTGLNAVPNAGDAALTAQAFARMSPVPVQASTCCLQAGAFLRSAAGAACAVSDRSARPT